MGCNSSLCVSTPIQSEDDFLAKYQMGRTLGKGRFGKVHQACDGEGKTYAVKVLDCAKESAGVIISESSLLQRVNNHKNVVRFYEAFGVNETHYIVMEACKPVLGLDHKNLHAQDLSRYFREMALGLAHCHAAGIVHRDVKPENFVLGGAGGQEIKLTDFGSAAALPKSRTLYDVVGTSPYMSPELLGEQGYDEQTDVWSLGVTAYVMLFGAFPYEPKERSRDAMKATILSGYPCPSFKPSARSVVLPENAVEFAKTLLSREKARISMQEVLQLRFVESASSGASHEGESGLANDCAINTEFDCTLADASPFSFENCDDTYSNASCSI